MIDKPIKDIMSRDFAKITPDMPVVEATSLLIKKELLGSPVVDADSKLLGWVSEQECLHVCVQVLYHNQRVSTVGNIMREDVLSVPVDGDLMDVISLILGDKPKTYPVVDANNKVLGIITRRLILKALDKEMLTAAKLRSFT